MAYFTRSQLQNEMNRSEQLLMESKGYTRVIASMESLSISHYDIFLSHSYSDSEAVALASSALKKRGFSVFVDWEDNPDADRAPGSPQVARKVKDALRRSTCLLSLASGNAEQSRWMPWECGYADAFSGKVAIFPLVRRSQDEFKDIGFMKLYPKAESRNSEIYVGQQTLSAWLKA